MLKVRRVRDHVGIRILLASLLEEVYHYGNHASNVFFFLVHCSEIGTKLRECG